MAVEPPGTEPCHLRSRMEAEKDAAEPPGTEPEADRGGDGDPQYAIETTIPLRWRDLDPYGHVNNAVYLTYLEQARDEAITRLLREALGEVGYVLARVAIDYRRELRQVDGPVVVSCRFGTLGGASIATRETIRTAAGDLAAEAEAVVVKFDRETRRSQRWTDAERIAFLAAGARPRE